MRVISLARRPVSEANVASNVLLHGTGALHINATRIAAPGETVTTHTRSPEASAKVNRNIYGEYGSMETHQTSGQQLGRWPANVILQHRAGCRNLGVRKVRGANHVGDKPAEYARNNVVYGEERRGRTPTTHVDHDGTETVADWECMPDCPVADLDVTSLAGGMHSAGGARDKVIDKAAYAASSFLIAGPTNMRRLGDTGGASRFFKQVQENDVAIPQDLIDYLMALIGPTHLADCKVLLVENPEMFAWSEHEDATVHGIIAVTPSKASPISEVEMWRVLKPGGHVLLIAPEDQKTGHTGACALEDAGFEIRDAILWVTEPEHYHYVPKPPKKERHAGCENLKFQRRFAEVLGENDGEELDPEDLAAAMAEAEAAVDDVSDATLAKGNVHPTAKPKAMMVRLLADIPKDQGPVLDCFMGSGSTGLSCLETGHSFIGIEREAEYLEIADTRVRHWDRQKVGEGVTIQSDHKSRELPKVEQSLDDFFGV